MDQSTTETLLISNIVLFGFFLLKQLVEYVLHFFKRKAEKDESKVDNMNESIVELKIQIAALQAQIEILMKNLYAIEKAEKDINALYKKLREGQL